VALKTTEKTPDSSRANCKVIWRLTATIGLDQLLRGRVDVVA